MPGKPYSKAEKAAMAKKAPVRKAKPGEKYGDMSEFKKPAKKATPKKGGKK